MKFKYQIPVLIFFISGIPNLKIASQDVGIGTTTPEYKLDIAGRARLRHADGLSAGIWYNKIDNTLSTFAGMQTDSIWGLWSSNGWKFLFDTDNGKLGIGNSVKAEYPLAFQSVVGDKISLFGGDLAPNANHYGLGIQGSLMQLFTPVSAADIAFGYGRSAAFTETMRIKGNGNVGIGNTNPLDAGLIVDKKVGAVNAMFGSNTTGVAIESNFPGVGLNCYYNAGRKTIAAGYASLITSDPGTGNLGLYNSDVSTAADATATLLPRLMIDKDGDIGIEGNTTPHSPLSFATNYGRKISLYGGNVTSHHGFGVQANVMQIYVGGPAADLVFGTGSTESLIELMRIKGTGNVGIGTDAPIYRVDIKNTTSDLFRIENSTALASNIRSDFYFKTGTQFTGAIKTIGTASNAARLGLFTFAGSSPTSLREHLSITDNGYVGIGTIAPSHILDVNGRVRIRHNFYTAGLWFANSTNTADNGFVGMYNDNKVGFYGENGGYWGLVMSTITGNVGIQKLDPVYPLHVVGGVSITGFFENTQTGEAVVGLYGTATEGVSGEGVHGTGHFGVRGHGFGDGGGDRYGIYGYANGGVTNWAGYFSGNVYSTGTYQGSDRKLKAGIQPLRNAINLITMLNPTTYTYKTKEYEQMQLPEGLQYGLIADEVKSIFPGAVKKATNPAQYEILGEGNRRKIHDEVEFEAINYTQMIPILIGAIQEQQKQIDTQGAEIDELKVLVGRLLKK